MLVMNLITRSIVWLLYLFFSSRRRHTRWPRDWSSDVCSSDLFPRSSWNFSCAPDVADDYDPKNIEGIGTGMMTVQEATTRSVNTAFVDMANQMDVRSEERRVGQGCRRGGGREARQNKLMKANA